MQEPREEKQSLLPLSVQELEAECYLLVGWVNGISGMEQEWWFCSGICSSVELVP